MDDATFSLSRLVATGPPLQQTLSRDAYWWWILDTPGDVHDAYLFTLQAATDGHELAREIIAEFTRRMLKEDGT